MGLDPTLLRGNPPAAEISLQNFSCLPWEPSQLSSESSALPTSLIVVKWFLLSACVPASVQDEFSTIEL